MYPSDLKYTKEHEWVKIAGSEARVGITDYAQKQLGDVVYLELPEAGRTFNKGDVFGTIESVKAVSELYAPVSGEVTEVNQALTQKPETVNSAPHESWMIVMKMSGDNRAICSTPRSTPNSRSNGVQRLQYFRMTQENPGSFQSRHIGPDAAARDEMVRVVGVPSLDALIDQTIPPGIRAASPLDLPRGDSEYRYLRRLRGIAERNVVARSYIGMGYYGCVTPSVILRNVFENPSWYTPVHALSGRDRPGPARVAAQFPDGRQGPDRNRHRDRVAPRRRHRGGRGDDDVPPRPDEEGETGAGESVPGVGSVLSADAGRAARPCGAAWDPPGDRLVGLVH